MAPLIAVLLVLLPFALYLGWRRLGGRSGEPSSGAVIALLLGVGLLLGGAVWFGLSRSLDRGIVYQPAVMDATGNVRQGGAAPR